MQIINTLKDAGKLYRDLGKIEEYNKILALQKEIQDIQSENESLRIENAGLKDRLIIKEALIFDRNTYWIKKDGRSDGPFCSCCWDGDQKLTRLLSEDESYFKCPKCKTDDIKVYSNVSTCYTPHTHFDPHSPI